MAEPAEPTLALPTKLEALSRLSSEVLAIADLDARITELLGSLERYFGYRHCMLLVPSDEGQELTMLACHGYPGGVGASVVLGQGIIGVAGERRRALRVNNVPREIDLFRAMAGVQASDKLIPLPGLPNAGSQAAVPASLDDRLALVLYVEDEECGRFGEDDAHVLSVVAGLLALAMRDATDEADTMTPTARAARAGGPPLRVRYYPADDSVFFDDEYVIKSLPGRILFRLLTIQGATGRHEFTKKELRLDTSLKLPPVRDNLDTRIILLRRRLAERFPGVQIVPAGRGRLALQVDRPFEIVTATAAFP